MEDKGSFWSRFLKRKRPQEAPTPPPEQPLSAGAQEREVGLKEMQKERAQKTFRHTVEQAQSGLKIPAPPGTGPLDLEKGKQEIAVDQSIERGAELRKKFAPKGTPRKRFRRIIQAGTKKDTSSPEQVVEKKTPETAAKTVGKTLSERKAQEIDRERLSKSVIKPTWPKEKTQKETPIEQKVSVPPFEPGFPGVEKWQPGKGAISIDEAKKIREKLKTEPDYSPEKPKEQS